jgi:maleylpyruvate isomerase
VPLPADATSLDATMTEVGGRTLELLARARALTADQIAAPSSLPGWTCGHVLAHLANHADAVAAVLLRARQVDDAGLMYPSQAERDRAIDAAASSAPEEHLRRLLVGAARLASAWRLLPAGRLAVSFSGTAGWTRPVRDVPWVRWRELALHAVDVGWPADFSPGDGLVARLLDESATALAGRGRAPALRLTDTGTGRTWTTTAEPSAGDLVEVAGPASELALWLTGRSDGAALSASGPLPTLPPWA